MTAKVGKQTEFSKRLRGAVAGLPRPVLAGVAVVVFALVGAVLLVASKAATPTDSYELENGTLASGASVVNDTTASAGKAVQFGQSATSGFTHPGVMLGRAQLDFVKAKIAAGQQPWSTAYSNAKSSSSASLSFVPKPVATITCSAGSPEQNCKDAAAAAAAAYTDALIWYYSGNQAYADKAIEIMDAYSSTVTSYAFDTTQYVNGLLEAAWDAENFVRAAEIIRYSDAGWSASSVSQFETLLQNVYLPRVANGWSGGGANWLASMLDATMGIGVFTDDRTVFNEGVGDWRAQVVSTFYLQTDANTSAYPNLVGQQVPIPPKGTNLDKSSVTVADMKTYWRSPSIFVSGLEGETCRDMSHAVFSFEAFANAAETARLQGIDLWGEQKTRMTTAMEVNAAWLNASLESKPQPSNWPCPSALNLGGTGYTYGWEVGYNHYASRLGVSLPQTQALITKIRPTGHGLHMQWETLTSAGTP